MAKVSGNRFFGEGGSPSESASYKRSMLAGHQRKAVIRIGSLEKGLVEIDERVTVVEANSFISPEVFKGINSSLLGISSDLNAIQNLIVEDAKFDLKASDADKLQTDRDKDKTAKLNKEGFLERGVNALKSGAKTVTKGITNSFAKFFEALALIFGGWMVDKVGDAIIAWNEGDTDKLKSIATEVGKALAALGGTFLAVSVGVPLVTSILTGLGMRMLFGGGAAAGGFSGIAGWFTGTMVPFLIAAAPWILLISGIGALTYWGVNEIKKWKEEDAQKQDEAAAGAKFRRLLQEGELRTSSPSHTGEWGYTQRIEMSATPPPLWDFGNRRAYDKQIRSIKKMYDENPYWFLKDMPGFEGKGSDNWTSMERHRQHLLDRIADKEVQIESLKAIARPGDQPQKQLARYKKELAELNKIKAALEKHMATKPKPDAETRLSSLQQIQLDTMASRLAKTGLNDEQIDKKLREYIANKGWVIGEGQSLRYQSKTKTKDDDELKVLLSEVTGSFVDGEVVTGAFGKETGVVKSWDANRRELTLINRTGAFSSDETLVGSQSKAKGVATSLTGNVLGKNPILPAIKELHNEKLYNNGAGKPVDEISSETSNRSNTIAQISTDTSGSPSIEIVPVVATGEKNNTKTPLVTNGEATTALVLITSNGANDYNVYPQYVYGIEVA